MSQQLNKPIAVVLLLIMFGLLGFGWRAWASPTQNPPACPAGSPGCDPVLHTGPVGQIKSGSLTLNTFGAALGLFVDKGKVGIGFNNPSARLDVRDSSSGPALLVSQEGTGNILNLANKLVATYTGLVGIGTTTPSQALDVNGPIRQSGAVLHADFAEDYQVIGAFTPGDIVSIVPDVANAVQRSTGLADQNIVGVISISPGYRINAGQEDWQPVALLGRVPTNVSLDNGPIEIGDPITASSVPGVGMKANTGDKIVGYALQAFNNDTQGQIFIFVELTYLP